MKKDIIVASALLLTTPQITAQNKTPNIVLILCDDLGYSDIGCYGGEVKTPNLDQLAHNGVRFTQFKNTGRSCPSRASLLTGCYPHKADLGWMTAANEKRDGYRGEMTRNLPTIAELLKQNGYATYMTGKWHVTNEKAFNQPNGSYPTERGFDRYYGSLSGGGSYYRPTALYSNLNPIKEVPDNYYYTQALTDSAILFIDQHTNEKPFFLYLAHYAPHLPLEAPKEAVESCRKLYEIGYDRLRQQRFEQLKQLKLIHSNHQMPIFNKEFNGKRPNWEELNKSTQNKWIEAMATYCAMIEIMDQQIGRIVQQLKEKNQYDNTIIIFLSDNGSTFESGQIKRLMADLSNTPFRSYKSFAYNGGISTPFIYSNPQLNKSVKGTIREQNTHIIDLLPTCLDIANIKYPSRWNGRKVQHDGNSILPYIMTNRKEKRILYFEHQTSCAIVEGEWKLVREHGKKPWELYNLKIDPFETKDLTPSNTRKVKALEKKWNNWAKQQNVLPFEYRPWSERIEHYNSIE